MFCKNVAIFRNHFWPYHPSVPDHSADGVDDFEKQSNPSSFYLPFDLGALLEGPERSLQLVHGKEPQNVKKKWLS